MVYPDIMAIHHPKYYQQGDAPPADWDDPSLVPFLSATGSYALALAGPCLWVNAAFHILANALLDAGIGAKTSSGYGRMQVQGFESLWASGSEDARMSQRRWIAVETLLTFWPPAPWARIAENSTSSAGTR